MKQFTGWKAEKNDRQCTGHSGNSMWRQRRLQYIRRNRKRLYEELQTSDRLNEHLDEVDRQADLFFSQLVKQLAEQQGIAEELKAENQLLWVQQMNNVQNVASEIVLNELLYC